MYKYYNLENLPLIDSRRRSLQTSSYDRKYENADFGQYLYTDEGEYVLFEEYGTGCIKSIWMAVTSDETILNFYFDGNDAPRWTTTTKRLFNEGIKALTGIGNSFEERGHYEEDDCHAGNCLINIPFENGLKITAIGKKKVYYHILYEMYAEGKTYLGDIDNTPMVNAFNNVRHEYSGERINIPMKLKRGYNDIYESEGAGVIREFTVKCPMDLDLTPIRFQAYFDDLRPCAMECPIEHLFACPLGYTEIDSYAVSVKEEDGMRVMSFYLPMVWWKRVSLNFVNRTNDPIEGIEVSILKTENTYDKEHTGYLWADCETGDTQIFSDWHLGSFNGRGHVVGIVQTCIGDQYCEGNEHFYINGEISPSINGTGTEDLYLGCYWPNSKYDSPVAGCVRDVWLENGRDLMNAFKDPYGYYRFFLDSPIAFDNGIKLDIQHGAVCQTYSYYSSTVFSYRVDQPSLIETDYISLESDASMKMHDYTTSGKKYTIEGKIESDMRAPLVTKSGYKNDNDGSVEFTIATLKNNKGVVIRRILDQTVSNCGAEVYVDGELAGIWNACNENEFFPLTDSDFYIPSNMTKDKDLLKIKIVPKNNYTDFEYKVLTFIL